MGPLSILPRLPRIIRRVYGTAAAAIAADPDCVVIIDSPGVHAPDRQAHPQAQSVYPDRQLRLAASVGVAAGACQAHALVHR